LCHPAIDQGQRVPGNILQLRPRQGIIICILAFVMFAPKTGPGGPTSSTRRRDPEQATFRAERDHRPKQVLDHRQIVALGVGLAMWAIGLPVLHHRWRRRADLPWRAAPSSGRRATDLMLMYFMS